MSQKAAARYENRLEQVKQNAKNHNDAVNQRVKRRLSYEHEERETLRSKLVDSMTAAEERRQQRVAKIKSRNSQHAMSVMKKAKDKAANEAKEHEVARVQDELAKKDETMGLAASLLKELEAHAEDKDFARLSEWMRKPSTLSDVQTVLPKLGAPAAKPRLLLALSCMAMDAERTFSDEEENEHDAIMKREALRFHKRFLKALRHAEQHEKEGKEEKKDDNKEARTLQGRGREPFAETARRASRFYMAWSAADKPHTLDQLMASVVAASVRQREQEGRPAEEMAPPEETLAQIRRLGGAEAEAEARRRFAGAWRQVRTTADLETTVMEVAQRAFWDAITHHASEGKYDSLFSVLGEMHTAMKALIAHSPRALDELDDKFDPAFLKQQVDHDALEASSVHKLMRYLAATIAAWHAPADDHEAKAWVDATEASLSAHEGEALPTFIVTCLIPFLRGAQERLQRVYQRMMEFAQEHAAARSQEQEDAGGSSSASAMHQQD